MQFYVLQTEVDWWLLRLPSLNRIYGDGCQSPLRHAPLRRLALILPTDLDTSQRVRLGHMHLRPPLNAGYGSLDQARVLAGL